MKEKEAIEQMEILRQFREELAKLIIKFTTEHRMQPDLLVGQLMAAGLKVAHAQGEAIMEFAKKERKAPGLDGLNLDDFWKDTGGKS